MMERNIYKKLLITCFSLVLCTSSIDCSANEACCQNRWNVLDQCRNVFFGAAAGAVAGYAAGRHRRGGKSGSSSNGPSKTFVTEICKCDCVPDTENPLKIYIENILPKDSQTEFDVQICDGMSFIKEASYNASTPSGAIFDLLSKECKMKGNWQVCLRVRKGTPEQEECLANITFADYNVVLCPEKAQVFKGGEYFLLDFMFPKKHRKDEENAENSNMKEATTA